MRKEGIRTVEATREAEEEWRKKVTELSDKTLFPGSDSWVRFPRLFSRAVLFTSPNISWKHIELSFNHLFLLSDPLALHKRS